MARSRSHWMFVFAFLVVLTAAVFGAVALTCRGRILPGVVLSGIPVGGLRPDQAAQLLRSRLPGPKDMEFVHAGQVWRVGSGQAGIERDISGAVSKAFALGRRGHIFARLKALARAVFFRHENHLSVGWKADLQRWKSWFRPLAGALYRSPRNASYDIRTGGILPEQAGLAADGDETLRRALRAAMSGKSRVTIAVRPLAAKTSARQLGATGARYVLAGFHTSFAGSDEDRGHNIALAAGRINGTVVPPGAVFSFNEIVGAPSLESGFRPAMEIINRRLVPGVGGGVCQVATTLYNAVLLAGMRIVERRQHSLLLSYVPPGRDATVYYGRIDFRFRNSTGGDLVILAGVVGSRVHVTLLGDSPPRREYEVVEHVVQRMPPPIETRIVPHLKPGEVRVVQEGAPGCRVEVWRLVEDGEQELVSVDTYPAQPRVEERGPEEADSEEGNDGRPAADVPAIRRGETRTPCLRGFA